MNATKGLNLSCFQVEDRGNFDVKLLTNWRLHP